MAGPDKKEIVDYLRNRQKAAEIEAKVNGINLWVLLGAIGLVSWQLMENWSAGLWLRHDVGLRILLLAEGVYLFIWISAPTRDSDDEPRLSLWNSSNIDSPLMVLVLSFLLLGPPCLFIATTGPSFGLVLPVLFGTVLTWKSIKAVADRLWVKSDVIWKFQEPEVGISKRSATFMDLLFSAVFFLSIAEGGFSLNWRVGSIPLELFKALALAVALYLLVLVAVKRKLESHAIDWTYELETDLLLDAVTPAAALTRIEYRALGLRCRDVVDKLFEDLDRQLAELDELFAKCKERLDDVANIPKIYQAEGAARVKEAVDISRVKLEKIHSDTQALADYLRKISNTKRPEIAVPLKSLTMRRNAYEERVADAQLALTTLIQKVSA